MISWETLMALRHRENPPKAMCIPGVMNRVTASRVFMSLLCMRCVPPAKGLACSDKKTPISHG
jgi:hypothetical protein